MWKLRRRRIRRIKRPSSVTRHYTQHKEAARALILARLEYWNQFYGYRWNRVAIRNQKTCWGSCSALGNLNFSYRLLFLPPRLVDYIVVHELCHLQQLNHSQAFWDLVEKTLPHYKKYIIELRTIEQSGMKALTLK